jgi:hypothetical protein
MPVKISDLANKATLAGTEQLEINDGGTSKRATAAAIAALVTTPNAAAVTIADAGGYYTGANVEAALQEVGADLAALTAPAAEDVTYDNGVSGLTATDVQAAIDEIVAGGGGGGGTAGKHAIYIAAGSMSPSASGGCASLATEATSANRPDLQYLAFDASTDEFAQFSIVMPKSWNEGTITYRAHWTHGATVTNFGVVWGLQALAVSNDDTIDAAYGTAVTVTDTGGTTSDLYTSDESSAITIAGTPAAEDMVFFRVYRDADNGSDNLAVDAKLLGITVFITTDAETDA